jgi:broad specificity phosphatase PhoE
MGNVDKDIHRTHADHAIPLSKRGHKQAEAAGKFLGDYFDENVSHAGRNAIRPRLWVSPYLRTRQTADGIEKGIGMVDGPHGAKTDSRIYDRRENIALCEQQFGLFDGIPDEDLPKRYPDEHAHYKKQEDFEGRFWARMPMGESRWDVALRVHQAFGTWHRDAERHNINNIIVVTHGVTARCIVMRWLHLSFDWIENERNPKNCSIRLIEHNEDKGYIHSGG